MRYAEEQRITMNKDNLRTYNFWVWFGRGSGGGAGFLRIVNSYLFVHLIIGSLLGLLIHKALDEAASTILLPLAGVFVGLAFAWAGNAQALLQTEEIDLLARQRNGGLQEYAFTYQEAILVLLVTLTGWGIAGLGFFDAKWLKHDHPTVYLMMRILLYTLSSLSVRECWHVVLGAQAMLLVRSDIKAAEVDREREKERTKLEIR